MNATNLNDRTEILAQYEKVASLEQRIKLIGQNKFGAQAAYHDAQSIKALPSFNQWERDFVTNVRCTIEFFNKAMSPKQEAIINKLIDRAFVDGVVVYRK